MTSDSRNCKAWHESDSYVTRFTFDSRAPLTDQANFCRRFSSSSSDVECLPDDIFDKSAAACRVPSCRTGTCGKLYVTLGSKLFLSCLFIFQRFPATNFTTSAVVAFFLTSQMRHTSGTYRKSSTLSLSSRQVRKWRETSSMTRSLYQINNRVMSVFKKYKEGQIHFLHT